MLGCCYNCIYCIPSFQETVARFTKLSGSNCPDCLSYRPHEHIERLARIPSYPMIFVCGDGDITFARPEFVRKIIARIKVNLKRCPEREFLFQSKNPQCFEKYLDDLREIEENVILVTTLETNRNYGYERISQAPYPSQRYRDFLNLDWKRKRVTIEPIMDFDLPEFVEWIYNISPEAVYLGYNSRPKRVQLPEPSPEKFFELKYRLEEFTEVILKNVDRLKEVCSK